MTREEWKKEFKIFMRTSGAFDKFCKNLKNLNDVTFDEYFDKVLEVDFPWLIDSAFTWTATPESKDDDEYWHRLHLRWRVNAKVLAF